MNGTLPLLVVTTVGSQADAERLAHALVQQRLAACVQIEAIRSVYRWQGAVQSECEWRLLAKTLPARYAAVEAALRALHPYSTPAIHAIATCHADAAYAAWLAAEIGMGDAEGPGGPAGADGPA